MSYEKSIRNRVVYLISLLVLNSTLHTTLCSG